MKALTYKHINIDFMSQQIFAADKELKLDPKAFHTLKLLVQERHRVVSSDELIEQVWDNRQINNEVVVSAIGRIRKIFKDSDIDAEVIRTVHKVGYKFCLDLVNEEAGKSLHTDNNVPLYHKKLNWLLGGALLITSLLLLNNLYSPVEKMPAIESRSTTEFVTGSDSYTEIFFIRHAEKENDGTDNPHLSEVGITRAKYWNKFFQNIQFDLIYTTEYHRNIETTALVKGEQSDSAIIYSPLSFEILEHVKRNFGKKILVVGHSNTIPDMLNRLVGSSQYEPMSHLNYNLIYQIIIDRNGNISSNSFYIEVPLESESND